VFPSSCLAELDFSVLRTIEQCTEVIQRDFEAKAPTGTDILERAESGSYATRLAVLRDLGQHLFWVNRYALPMYEKRPVRWRDVPKHRDDVYVTTEVGQHQMWAAQRFQFQQPNHWMTSGGLGTMGYGLPAAVGVQMAHPGALVIDIAGEASVQMTMQEMSTAMQYELPIKIFILNNEYMGMVRQWQEILHGKRYSHSYSEALPDFVKMAEAFGCVGLRATKPSELDDKIKEMISVKKPVLFDVRVDPAENCYPMIPSGGAHNEMLLSPDDGGEISDAGKMLV